MQINPITKAGVPRSAREIAFDVNRITFNQPLLRDVELIEAAREAESRAAFGATAGRRVWPATAFT